MFRQFGKTILQDAESHVNSLTKAAAFHARDAELLCVDVAAAIFPTSSHPPSEQQIAGVSKRMTEILSSLEGKLSGSATQSNEVWRGLLKSPLCRDRQFIDFLMARYIESQLEQRLHRSNPVYLAESLPTEMLQSSDAEIAEAAQSVLVASSLSRREAPLRWHHAPPELLHRLCWRLAALLFDDSNAGGTDPEGTVSELLAGYDPLQTVTASAAKLLHLAGDGHRGELMYLERAGIALFAQYLADSNGLAHDHILRLMDGYSPAPLAILQRGAGIPKETALENTSILFGFDLLPRDILAIEQGYEDLDSAMIREIAQSWKEARLNMLSGRAVDGGFTA